MPTRETHPIDELFHRTLAGSEASPPPSVWEGIQNARRRRRWLPLWFRLNSVLLFIIPAAALTTYLAWPKEVEHVHAGMKADLPFEFVNNKAGYEPAGVTNASLSPSSSGTEYPAAQNAVAPADVQPEEQNASPGGTPLAEQTFASTDPTDPGQTIQRNRSANYAAAPSMGSEKQQQGTPAARMVRNDATASTAIGSGTATFLQPLTIARPLGTLETAPYASAMPPPYLLPHAEWVISGIVGRYDVGRTWRGRDGQLVKALNDTEANTTTYALGATIGRHWHSGFGITTGILGERSEQKFHFVDRRTNVTHEVITNIVSLNSMVFVNTSDTIEHYTQTEKKYEVNNSRMIVRIPLEGHYHRNRGRFHYGIRAGVALELTTTRQDHSLTLDQNAANVSVTQLGEDALRRRYPAMLIASAGIDLGYTISENWSLGINPLYMAGAAPLSSRGDHWSSPSRFGFQFRLSHHLIPKRSR